MAIMKSDDLVDINIHVNYPEWLDNLSDEEFEIIIVKAEEKLVTAFANEIYEAEKFWRDKKATQELGQMSLEDYGLL